MIHGFQWLQTEEGKKISQWSKFLKKLNLTVVVFCVCCIAFVAFLAYNPSHAFFEVHKDAIGVNTAKVDLLFDKYDESVFTLENNEDSLEEKD